jgi:hypothetical protein
VIVITGTAEVAYIQCPSLPVKDGDPACYVRTRCDHVPTVGRVAIAERIADQIRLDREPLEMSLQSPSAG